MQIPIYEGIYVDPTADFRTSYPVNLIPTPKKTGFSDGYLRTAEGVALFGATPGRERGGINWNGTLYRACGANLCAIDATGTATVLGAIGDNGLDAVFSFSFDRLAIASAGVLYYYQPSSGVTSVTDPDIGAVNYVQWIDGYFAVTDGVTVAVTELNDPYAVNPLKYGSAEESPDAIVALLRINGQLVAVGQLTNEFFQNIGGSLFPFQRITNALIERGAVGAYAVALYNQTFAFVGNGINEAAGVYLAAPGGTVKISTREVDTLLAEVGAAILAGVRVETRVDKAMQLLYVHLPTQSLVYDISATAIFGVPIWFRLTSGADGLLPYRCRNFIRAYDKWICGDLQAQQTGQLTNATTTQFGARVPWQFDTVFTFNQGMGALFHQVELAHKPGASGSDAVIWHQWSDDGLQFSTRRQAQTIKQGMTLARALWMACGLMRTTRVLRFNGTNDTPDSFAAVTVNVEPLLV